MLSDAWLLFVEILKVLQLDKMFIKDSFQMLDNLLGQKKMFLKDAAQMLDNSYSGRKRYFLKKIFSRCSTTRTRATFLRPTWTWTTWLSTGSLLGASRVEAEMDCPGEAGDWQVFLRWSGACQVSRCKHLDTWSGGTGGQVSGASTECHWASTWTPVQVRWVVRSPNLGA